jgi:hypothetical protein
MILNCVTEKARYGYESGIRGMPLVELFGADEALFP